MGHKGSIEAMYTTNKGILPDSLISEMRDAYSRSEEFLDLEKINENPLEKQKTTNEKLGNLTPEELEVLQGLLKKMDGSVGTA